MKYVEFTKVHAKRLLKLADYLETVPEENFRMSQWCLKDPECGTAACAAGHAAMMKPFRDLGLGLRHAGITETGLVSFEPIRRVNKKNAKELEAQGLRKRKSSIPRPDYSVGVPLDYVASFDATNSIFGSDSIVLFEHKGPQTPKGKAAEIRVFVFRRFPELNTATK